MEHFDVIVVGAGLSGVAAGYHLGTTCPDKTYVILEGRREMGGTWDLFRYPGIRSDSDMFTLGYSFRPWRGDKAIADGPSILAYVKETAKEFGIDAKIRFGHWVVSASWSSDEARWTLEVKKEGGEVVRMSASFLFMCSGYYDYAEGYAPEFPGAERFQGRIVHPQFWTDDIDYAGKKVVVIGSGATAVTLVPELAKRAAKVTMLQRSPTYIVSLPARDPLLRWLDGKLPDDWAYGITRWKNIAVGLAMYNFCRRFPEQAKKLILGGVKKALGPNVDVQKHFTPRYDPWDQRLCLVPNGDLFESVRSGAACVVTDRIETLTETGIRLESGEELEADLIVTATGLKLKLAGGVRVVVDGRPVEAGNTFNYKGAMLSGVPNFAMALGYTNASWTLKCDLVCKYVARLVDHMGRAGYRYCVPNVTDPDMGAEPLLNFSSGYVQRSIHELPKQGKKAPWRLYQNYLLDLLALRHGRIEDGSLEFHRGA